LETVFSVRSVSRCYKQDNLGLADTLEQIFTTNSDVDRTFTVSTEQVVNDFLKQPPTDRMRATNHSKVDDYHLLGDDAVWLL
jgi:hypothetical protein